MNIPDVYKYRSIDVALYIIARANTEKIGINMPKVQVLLYLAYGAYLAVHHSEGRLTDEHPHAWTNCVVFPQVKEYLDNNDVMQTDIKSPLIKEIAEDSIVEELISLVFKRFGRMDKKQLAQWSTMKKSAWEKTVDNYGWGKEIPDNYILPYFRSLLIIKE